MKKSDWDREFGREISDLSEEEQRRALEYYNELYLDKLDGGDSEESIVAEFGSPSVCAKRIKNGLKMSGFDDIFNDSFSKKRGTDYWDNVESAQSGKTTRGEESRGTDYWDKKYGETEYERKYAEEHPQPSKKRPRKVDTAGSIILSIVLGILDVIAVIAIWSLAISVAIAVYSLAVVAVSVFIASFIALSAPYAFIATLGIALLFGGLSFILIPLVNKMFNYVVKFSGMIFDESNKFCDTLRRDN